MTVLAKRRFHIRFLIIAFLVAGLGTARAADSSDEQFLAGLRQRRLFDLAEAFCQERLRDQKLTEWERGTLTLELIRTLAEQALNVPQDQRESLWKKADQSATQFLQSYPQD